MKPDDVSKGGRNTVGGGLNRAKNADPFRKLACRKNLIRGIFASPRNRPLPFGTGSCRVIFGLASNGPGYLRSGGNLSYRLTTVGKDHLSACRA
jgi:hypothetical protein